MADWALNTTRVFVQDMSTKDEQIIARLNPLAGDTIKHVFGWDDLIVNLNAYVVGLTDMSTIRGYTTTASSVLLYSPLGETGYPYLVKSVNAKLVSARCQTLRPDLDEDAPVYLVDIELWYDG
jgi:hypothetical protein